MGQSNIVSELQYNSPTGPSIFELLPVETRCRIYEYLFPDLHFPFKIDLYAKYPKGSRDDFFDHRVIRKIEDGTLLVLRIFYGSDERLRPQLGNAMSMTATCRTTRTEVVPKVYSNFILAWSSEGSLLEFTSSLTPFTAQLLHRVKVPDDILPQPAFKNRICTAIAGLTGLQDLLVEMEPAADPATKGTAWMPYHLRWLKQLRTTLPQLSHSHYYEGRHKSGDYSCARLSTSNAPGPGEITFDIDAEYQKWLDANKQRRIRKQALQNAKEGGEA